MSHIGTDLTIVGDVAGILSMLTDLTNANPALTPLCADLVMTLRGEGCTSLTDREAEVMALIATGATNKEIARRLDVAEVTVKFHSRRIFKKLGARNRTDAVRRAHEAGVLGGAAPEQEDGRGPDVEPCPDAFQDHLERIRQMMRRERAVYHVGDLLVDRKRDTMLAGVAAAYQEAAKRGLVILSQRRVAPGRFEYVAIRKGA